MRCERCNGLMVGERTWDMNGTGGDLCVAGYRCPFAEILSIQ